MRIIHIFAYIYISVCVCVCVCARTCRVAARQLKWSKVWADGAARVASRISLVDPSYANYSQAKLQEQSKQQEKSQVKSLSSCLEITEIHQIISFFQKNINIFSDVVSSQATFFLMWSPARPPTLATWWVRRLWPFSTDKARQPGMKKAS